MSDFLDKMFVAGALGFGSGGGECGSLLGWDVGADEFECNFVESLLRGGWTIVIVKGTECEAPAA